MANEAARCAIPVVVSIILAAAGASAADAATSSAVTWTQIESATPGANGGIVKAKGGWYSAAVSTQVLQASGLLSFQANNVGASPRVNASRVCLDSGGYDVNSPRTLDYCVVPGAGVASVYVRGTWRADAPLSTADVVDIAVEAGSVRFRRNGATFFSVVDAATFPLFAVFTTNFDGYGLTRATLTSDASASPAPTTPVPVAWGSIVQAATASEGAITKTTGSSWFAAATSMQTLSGAGRLDFRVSNTGANPRRNAARVCLDAGTREVNSPTTLDYCLVPGAGVATVYVRGMWRADTPIVVTDALAIRADGSAVRFEKNGAPFFSLAEAPSWPLAAVWTTAFDGYGLTRATLTQGVATAPPIAPTPPPPPPPAPTPPSPAPVNAAPTITGVASKEVTVGRAYAFMPKAADANGDALTFGIANRPAWAQFDTRTGGLTGTPSAADVGTYANVTIRVSDGKQTVALAPFTIAVNAVSTGTTTLTWEAPTTHVDGSPLTTLAGYRVLYGPAADRLAQSVKVANPSLTRYTMENLSSGRWYFAIVAYTSSGAESPLSGIVSTTITN